MATLAIENLMKQIGVEDVNDDIDIVIQPQLILRKQQVKLKKEVVESMNQYNTEQIFSVKGRTAVITGASKGIGKEIAKLLYANGANIALIARNEQQLKALKAELSDYDSRTRIYPFDLTQHDKLEALAESIYEDFGQIDILVNNAGINIQNQLKK